MTYPIYRGFSSANNPDKINTQCYNIELVRRDILNEFNTNLGERVRRGRNFGTILYQQWMNLQTDNIPSLIYNDVKRIITSDPRVSLLDMNMSYGDHSVIVNAQVQYIEFDMNNSEWITLTFTYGTD